MDIIRKYEKSDNRIKLVNLKKNVGPAEGRNIAIRNSNSNLIFILDSDDLMLPDRLYHQKKFLDITPIGKEQNGSHIIMICLQQLLIFQQKQIVLEI